MRPLGLRGKVWSKDNLLFWGSWVSSWAYICNPGVLSYASPSAFSLRRWTASFRLRLIISIQHLEIIFEFECINNIGTWKVLVKTYWLYINSCELRRKKYKLLHKTLKIIKIDWVTLHHYTFLLCVYVFLLLIFFLLLSFYFIFLYPILSFRTKPFPVIKWTYSPAIITVIVHNDHSKYHYNVSGQWCSPSKNSVTVKADVKVKL